MRPGAGDVAFVLGGCEDLESEGEQATVSSKPHQLGFAIGKILIRVRFFVVSHCFLNLGLSEHLWFRCLGGGIVVGGVCGGARGGEERGGVNIGREIVSK